MDSKIIVALDYPDANQALSFAEKVSPDMCRLKIGKILFTREGPALVKRLNDLGFDVFLDLKFHDIPNTVVGALKMAADLGVWMVNVHASGGRVMLEKSSEAYHKMQSPPLLIAVTVLTSMSEAVFNEVVAGTSIEDQVINLTKLSYQCGLDGVVCSPLEAAAAKQNTAKDFITVTPGIRLADSTNDDQTRVMTPSDAIKNGSDYLVIGRPITQAPDPIGVLNTIKKEAM